MHILYIHQHFCTPDGSTGTRSYEFAKKLTQAGHKVTMVCGSFEMADTGISSNFNNGVRVGDVDGIKVVEISVSYSNYDGFSARIKKFISFSLRATKYALFEKYDVVFATSTPLTSAIPGIFAKVFRNKRFIFEVRDLWPELPKAMGILKNKLVLTLLFSFEKLAYKLANQCVGLSPGIVSGIQAKVSDRKKHKVFLLPNGCDVEFFSEPTSAKINFRNSDDEFIAIFAGAHGKANGLNKVIDAARYLCRSGNKIIRIVFVGNGAMKPELLKRAHDLPNCTFIDPVPKTELRGLLQSADLGLMVLANVPEFYFGTSPNKFFDYIATGLPVLVNYPGWVANLIKSYGLGESVVPDSAEAFANALIKMSMLPAVELAKMRDNAKKLSLVFSRKNISSELISLIENQPITDNLYEQWSGKQVI